MTATRLTQLRAELARQGLDGFLVPRADEHLGEYVPANAERLCWLTGFSGSAGLAVVLAGRAAVFTDGRYVLQLAAQTDPALWERRHITDEPAPAWLAAHAPGGRIGYDPLLFSEEALQRYAEAGVTLVAVERNPVDAIWSDRPAAPIAPAVPQALEAAGRDSAQKREEVAAGLRAAGQDAAVLTDPASIAWLLNIRGADVPYTPFALGFALLHADAGCELFMAPEKVPEATRAWLGNAVSVQPREALPGALARLAGRRVRVDAGGAPAWFAQRLRAAGAEVVAGMDPCLLPKACKNEVERQGARNAHARDAVAVCRFLRWLESAAGRESEMSAAERLLALRGEVARFRGESFPAISGAGPNGAVIHYRVTPESSRPIGADEVYLIDSGAQYTDGTTDVTRTVWTGPGTPPAMVRDRVTRVLKGHIAIATLVFPQGVAGAHLDGFARLALWQAGLDYDHGTGHGVGSYLSVHEGPVSLSRAARPVPLAAGMILSNEPGYYLPGAFGVRLENLLLVRPAELPDAAKPFLRFETLTLAPFDRRLIEPSLLTAAERAWLDGYHARVLAEVGPHLAADDRAWLAAACAPLAGGASSS
ncbi:MAG: X-Pro aminopeptidase [Rhodospirillales bacterium 70-18]|nr:aminopeptidase P family protein [Rhodospirillales bacterium]OJY78320.1 MAG: X-Pro aminopeptidase [Rhodospirillales bacterium 70-18]